MSEPTALRLNASLDIAPYRQTLQSIGRVQVCDILEQQSAKRILTWLEMDRRWNLVTDLDGRHLDLDAAAMEKQSPQEREAFLSRVYGQAEHGFAYLYENIPIYDIYHRGDSARGLLREVFELVNSEAMIAFARELTGASDIGFADAQATKYRAGHFLNEHNDGVEGKDRRAAFVLNLSPKWRVDWGGLTLFVNDDGEIDGAISPRFNALNVFLVPQRHSVTAVAPFAGGSRYSITGWFRAGVDPMASKRP
ncbi:MAG: hypothetical protein GC153_04070 [Alphaproteobacteria bacterium]|nr:hypothetical protein [Alphaproteobacteria bacterium]